LTEEGTLVCTVTQF